LFVEPDNKEAQAGKKTTQFFQDGINMCHAKLIGEDKTINSWRAMIRLHKRFVEGKWPGDMTSTEDAGGKLARVMLYWDKVVMPGLAKANSVVAAYKPFALEPLWTSYAQAHNILQVSSSSSTGP